jgi:hypothetical protein
VECPDVKLASDCAHSTADALLIRAQDRLYMVDYCVLGKRPCYFTVNADDCLDFEPAPAGAGQEQEKP